MTHLAQYCEYKDLKLFFSQFLIYTLLEPSDFDKMAEIQENIKKIVDLNAKIMIGQCSLEEICKKLINLSIEKIILSIIFPKLDPCVKIEDRKNRCH